MAVARNPLWGDICPRDAEGFYRWRVLNLAGATLHQCPTCRFVKLEIECIGRGTPVPDAARAKVVDMKSLGCGGILWLRAYELEES